MGSDMTANPGRYDWQARTGATTTWGHRFHRAGDAVIVGDLEVDDWIIYEDRVWKVYSLTPTGDDRILVKLGHGYVYEPSFTAAETDILPTAPAATWEAVDMRVLTVDDDETTAPVSVEISTSLSEDDTLVTVTVTQEWLEPFQVLMDYVAPARTLVLPYDLHGTFDGVPTPVLTGTLTIVRSAASPDVEAPEEEP